MSGFALRSAYLGADIGPGQPVLRLAETENSTPWMWRLSASALERPKNPPRRLGGRVSSMGVSQHSRNLRVPRKRASIDGLRFRALRHEKCTHRSRTGISVWQN